MTTKTETIEGTVAEYVTAMIGGQLFGLPISRVQDVFMPERLTRVPLSSAEIAGVLNLRGRIVTVVNMRALADVGRSLQLGEFLRLGRGEEGTGGRDKSSILADTLEAVLGAIYLDKGLSRAAALVRRLFEHRVMEAAGRGAALDYKTSLQELAASSLGGMPSYAIEEEGPDHAKRFTATVSVAGTSYGSGKGRSKKEAEQQAAREAFESLAANRMVTGTGDAGQTDVVPADPAPRADTPGA